MNSFRQKQPLVWVLAAAVIGALAALGVQRLFSGTTAEVTVEADAGATAQSPPDSAVPDPVDPGPARAAVIEVLSRKGVPVSAVEHGVYPLRGGADDAATLPLVSFTCPAATPCADVLAAVSEAATAAGYEVAGAVGGDTPGRPTFRALTQQGRPALALRAFPSGPRLVVVVRDAHTASEADLLGLESHVTFALDPLAPGAAGQIDRLSAAGREVVGLLKLPAGATAEQVKSLAEKAAESAPPLVGIGTGAPWLGTARLPLGAVLDVVRSQALYFFEAHPEPGSLVPAMARATGSRMAAGTHRLDDSGALSERLRAIEAALVLDGAAVVVAAPDPLILAGLRPFLAGLKHRRIHLLRLSEITR